jgi:hypothetical protein
MDRNEARRVKTAAARQGYRFIRILRDPDGPGYLTGGKRDDERERRHWRSLAAFEADDHRRPQAGTAPAPARPAHRPATGTGGTDVAVLDQRNAGSLKLCIGKELWRAIGSPARVALAMAAGGLTIAPTRATGPGTYALTGPPGGVPSCNIGRRRARETFGLAPGRYPATIVAGALLVGDDHRAAAPTAPDA